MASSLQLLGGLEKFTGGNIDLNSWLREFDRFCVVANKTEDNVKGQLLMLRVGGQAKAILETFEDQEDGPQPYSALKAKLKEKYNTTAIQEIKMTEFESRTQDINESEEEFMFQLNSLYSLANPNQNEAVKLTAIKRKFLQGISPELRKNIYIFCSDPHAATVTRDQLVTFSQRAKLLTTPQTATHTLQTPSQTQQVASMEPIDVIAAMNNLSTQMKENKERTDQCIQQQEEIIAAFQENRGGFRGGYRGGYQGQGRGNSFRGGRGRGFNNGNNGNNNSNNNRGRGSSWSRGGNGQNNQRTCYNCGGSGHIARFCMSGN